MKKFIIIAIVLIIAALGYYFFVYGKNSNENPYEIDQITAEAFKGDLVVSIHSNGRVTPVQTVEIKSKASGEIIELGVDVGDYVHKGDLICRLDTATVMNSYLQAKADLNVAQVTVKKRRREFDRQKTLFEKELLSEQELDNTELLLEQAKASLVRAEAAFSIAQEQLEDTEIRSPINGIVLQKQVEEGQIISSGVSTVTGGTLIMQIAEMDSVYVVAEVDETDIGQVEAGQRVKVNADAYPDLNFEGRVEKIAPMASVEQNVTVFEVTTQIDNSEGYLKAGMNSSIEIITAEAYGAVLVPNDAVKDPEAVGYTGEIAQGEQKIGEGAEGQKRPSREEMREKMKNMSPEEIAELRKRRQEQQEAMADKKVVMVKREGQFVPQLVSVGKSNLDYTQVISGISVGDTVDATPVSMMMRQRAEMRERMEQRSGSMGGLRKSE
ncbi:MAG TPA: efflux RND transporter periplasmic adaptor subunit [candidate division Zixibacteria bacterium]|nr:efflux RND transporter periplasmic adaptor subunit [candidate division Zixibacteria bacterium]